MYMYVFLRMPYIEEFTRGKRKRLPVGTVGKFVGANPLTVGKLPNKYLLTYDGFVTLRQHRWTL